MILEVTTAIEIDSYEDLVTATMEYMECDISELSVDDICQYITQTVGYLKKDDDTAYKICGIETDGSYVYSFGKDTYNALEDLITEMCIDKMRERAEKEKGNKERD